MKTYEKARVISSEFIADGIVSLWLETGFTESVRAGQFVSFYLSDPSKMLPRPISVCDISRRLSALRFVFRIAGEGTAQLSKLKTGDTVTVAGPLGNGYPLTKAAGKRVLLCGGGLGIPPLLGVIRDLTDEPCAADPVRGMPKAVTAALGYASKPFLLQDFKELTAVFTASMDGTEGVRGTVLDAVSQISLPYDLIFACGPKMMLRAVADFAAEKGIPCYVSMEERMACGIGACLGCVCRTKTPDPHYGTAQRRVCADGPVFDAAEIAWE